MKVVQNVERDWVGKQEESEEEIGPGETLAKRMENWSAPKGTAERRVKGRRERTSGDKGETEEENERSEGGQREEARWKGGLSWVETWKGRQKGERMEMEGGMRESRNFQRGKRTPRVRGMEGEAHKQRLGIQEHNRPSGEKIQER